MRAAAPAPKDGPRINEEIRVREVHLIDKDGANRGNVTDFRGFGHRPGGRPRPRRDLAQRHPAGLQAPRFRKVQVPGAEEAAEARKKQKVVEVKEIKFRPMIDDHDYDVKMRAMQRFFEEGDKVKVTLRFRGREMAHQELGARLLERVKGDTEKLAKVEMDARFEGRQMIMILAPR